MDKDGVMFSDEECLVLLHRGWVNASDRLQSFFLEMIESEGIKDLCKFIRESKKEGQRGVNNLP